MTVFDIWRGLEEDADRALARRALRGVRVYAVTEAAAKRAAEVHQRLAATPIGERDTLIAGGCLAIARPLLTANVCRFRRVQRLDVIQAR